jgi:hypothetical protein
MRYSLRHLMAAITIVCAVSAAYRFEHPLTYWFVRTFLTQPVLPREKPPGVPTRRGEISRGRSPGLGYWLLRPRSG